MGVCQKKRVGGQIQTGDVFIRVPEWRAAASIARQDAIRNGNLFLEQPGMGILVLVFAKSLQERGGTASA